MLNQRWWFLFWGWAGRTHRGVLLLIPAQDEAVLPLHLLHPVFTDLLEYITSQHVRLTNIYLPNQAQKNILNFKGHKVGCLHAPFGHEAILNQTLFKNISIVFKEQFASSKFYGWQRGLMERNRGNQKPHKLMAGVCSGLIMGSVDPIQHRTKALISAMSHLFFFSSPFFWSLCSSVCIHCYRAHNWLSLMDICHASDSVPKRFRRQRSSFKTSGTRRMQAWFCRELADGVSPRVPLIPPTTSLLTPTTPR